MRKPKSVLYSKERMRDRERAVDGCCCCSSSVRGRNIIYNSMEPICPFSREEAMNDNGESGRDKEGRNYLVLFMCL